MSLLKLPTCLRCAPASSTPAARYASLRTFHDSTSQRAESQKARAARLTRKRNDQAKTGRTRDSEQNRPHVVLGTRPGDDAKWNNCDLARVMVKPEELYDSPPAVSAASNKVATVPFFLSYGLDGSGIAEARKESVEFFFKDLPEASVHQGLTNGALDEIARTGDWNNLVTSKVITDRDAIELQKTKNFAPLVDLRNANARGIAFENRRRIIAAFSPPGKGNDTGYTEVQVALLTMKIRNMWEHLMRSKKDIPGRRAVRMLIHQRAKLLKYLKRKDRDRYDRILQRVALEPGAVEGELVV